MCKVLLNSELNGVEMYFQGKPSKEVREDIKSTGFRWNGKKVCWYAKQSVKTMTKAKEYEDIEDSTVTKVVSKVKKVVKKLASLWDRVQFVEGTADTSKYNYRFIGSNFTNLSCKDTAKEIRKHLKKQFPEVKFSVTSSYNKVDIDIKSSPYCNDKLEDNRELECLDYRRFEEAHNKELLAIKDYCTKLLSSYNYDDSDSMTDYFNTHFYGYATIDYNYIQTEQSEETKENIENFRGKLAEQEKAEEEQKEIKYQEYLKKQEQRNKEYQERIEQEQQEVETINNNIDIKELEENKQYYVLDAKFAKLNKNNTIEEYEEEVAKDSYNLEDIKISKEVHFKNADSLEYFSNLLLNNFDFLDGTGGSNTDDKRVNSMADYRNMSKEEQKTVKWYREGIAIYINNKLQFVVDAQGYSYARYVGLVDDSTQTTKEYTTEQIINNKKVEELKEKVDTLTDISTTIITNNNIVKTWNTDNWTDYKKLMKQQLKKYNFKLTKSIIQQIPENLEQFKNAMYKLLTEVDSIQDQFSNADIKQGDKLTLFYISDFGGIVTSRITLDSVESTSYAQYDNTVKLTYKPQNKRKLYQSYFYSTLLVYEGWQELPVNVLHKVETKKDFTITKSRYSSCDYEQYNEILKYFDKQQGIKPIVNTYKPQF